MIELPYVWNRYTWNDKHGGSRIFSKIDWAFVNKEWLDTLPALKVNFLMEGISDHCPLKIEKEGRPSRPKRSFKYCNVWAKHPKCLEVVQQGWQPQGIDCKMFQVVKSLKSLKKRFQVLNKEHFRNILVEAEEDRIALAQAQTLLHSNPTDSVLQVQEKQKCRQFQRSSYLAKVFL